MEFSAERFFSEITSEVDAIELVWRSKCGGKSFECKNCQSERFYEIKTRPEVRTCKGCAKQNRVRSGTMFESSKTSLLIWVKAVFYMMQGKRGISASELKRHLGLKSYGLVWCMLQKIRSALQQRDAGYCVGEGVVELDGAFFGKRETGNQSEAFVAIETKDWIDENGKPKSKAGFAKVYVAKETKENAQKLVDQSIKKGAMVNTDGKFKNLDGVDHDYQVVSGKPEVCKHWLPWVHRFISNAKSWINGTHHGVSEKHLERYLGEHTYRFNRRHDMDRLFHRALTACAVAKPLRLCALS